MPEEITTPSVPDAQRAPDTTLQRSTPNEDAASQRDTAGEPINDPEKKKLHEEAASYRKRSRELEQQLKAYQDADEQKKIAALSDVEKATKRATEAEQHIQSLRQKLVMSETRVAAQGMNFYSPEIAAKLVFDKLEYDKDGNPTNLADALTALAKENPFMVKETSTAPASTPAQSSNAPQAPRVPAMNPDRVERTSFSAPNTPPPGKPVHLSDLTWKR